MTGTAKLAKPQHFDGSAGPVQAVFGCTEPWGGNPLRPGSASDSVFMPFQGVFQADANLTGFPSVNQSFTLKILYPGSGDSHILQFTKLFSDIGDGSWACDYEVSCDLQEWIDATDNEATAWRAYETLKDGATLTYSLRFMPGTAHEEVLSGSATIGTVGVPTSVGQPLNGRIACCVKATGFVTTETAIAGAIAYSDGNALGMGAGVSKRLEDHFNGPAYSPATNFYYDVDYAGGISVIPSQAVFTPPATTSPARYPLNLTCKLANCAPAGYDLAGELFAHKDPYPTPMTLSLLLVNDLAAATDPTTRAAATANGLFSDTHEGAGYKAQASLAGKTTGTDAALPVDQFFANAPVVTGLSVQIPAASLAANQEDVNLAGSVPLFWKKWDALTLTQASEVTADDGSSVTPADGTWTPSTGVTLSIVSGAVQATIPHTAASPRVTRYWPTTATRFNASCYRYATIRFRVSGATNLPVTITFGAQSSNFNGRYRSYDEEAGGDGVWVDRIIDLCSPDAYGFLDSTGEALTPGTLPEVDSQSSRFPLNTTGDGPYWGASLLRWIRFEPQSIPGGVDVTLDIDSIKVTAGNPFLLSIFNPQLGRVDDSPLSRMRAITDGRLSLETVYAKAAGTRTIAEIVTAINGMPDGAGSDNRGFSATAGGGLGDGFHDSARSAAFLGGGGAYYDSGSDQFVPFIDVQAAGGTDPSLIVPAMTRYSQMVWYAGCGDVLGFGDGSFGGAALLKATRVLRANGNGLLFDLDGAPVTGMVVDAFDVYLGQAAGSGVSGATAGSGYYSTGAPYGRAHRIGQNTRLTPRSANSPSYLTAWANDWRHRASFRVIQAGGGNPWNLQHGDGSYHSAHVNATGIVYRRSDTATPHDSHGAAWSTAEVQVTNTATDNHPRLGKDYRGRLHLTFERSSNAYATYSDDDGLTWSAPAMAITGGTKPTLAVGVDGTVVRAAVVSGTPRTIQGQSQATGETAFSSTFTFKDDSGADLSVADDTFHIQQGHEGPSRWLLHVLIEGEAETSHWTSADECRTWTRVS